MTCKYQEMPTGARNAAFAYDGSQPANVVRLLVLLALTLLPLPGRVPGLRHVQDLLATLNPGAWAASPV